MSLSCLGVSTLHPSATFLASECQYKAKPHLCIDNMYHMCENHDVHCAGTYLRVLAICATSPSITAPWRMMQHIPVWWEKTNAPPSSLLKVFTVSIDIAQ